MEDKLPKKAALEWTPQPVIRMRRFFHGDTKKFAVQLCNLHQSDNRHETLELLTPLSFK